MNPNFPLDYRISKYVQTCEAVLDIIASEMHGMVVIPQSARVLSVWITVHFEIFYRIACDSVDKLYPWRVVIAIVLIVVIEGVEIAIVL